MAIAMAAKRYGVIHRPTTASRRRPQWWPAEGFERRHHGPITVRATCGSKQRGEGHHGRHASRLPRHTKTRAGRIINGPDMRVFDGHDLDTLTVADVMTPRERLVTGVSTTHRRRLAR